MLSSYHFPVCRSRRVLLFDFLVWIICSVVLIIVLTSSDGASCLVIVPPLEQLLQVHHHQQQTLQRAGTGNDGYPRHFETFRSRNDNLFGSNRQRRCCSTTNSATSGSLGEQQQDQQPGVAEWKRRLTLQSLVGIGGILGGGGGAMAFMDDDKKTTTSIAASTNKANSRLLIKQTKQFAYEFEPPIGFIQTNKLLPTHLDEINFQSTMSQRNGYQFGITIDPVRIDSLRSFGTPEEVAAKVVLAELKRDGIMDVTLMEDPVAAPNNEYYQLNYLSVGTRGKKRFITKFSIQNQFLYALTAQCKEEDYELVKEEMLSAVRSFHVIPTIVSS